MKLIKIIPKRIKTIKVGVVVKTLFRLAIRAKHLIRPELNYKKYYLKATPWLTPERKAPLLISSFKFKFSLIPLIVCLLVIFSFVALITRINSRKTPKVQAFNPQLSPAPAGTNYLYQNITNGYKVYLGDRLQEAKPRVKFEEENSSAEFSLEQVPDQNAQFKNEDNKAVVYKNIWPGIDLKYSLTEKGVKEEIIISSRDSLSQLAAGQFKFNLNLKNAVPRKSLEGETTGFFVEPTNGQYVFHIPQPFMVDAKGSRSETVELKIEQHSVLDNNGSQSTYTITLIPDSRWLDSAFYPVIIDPSVVHDESSEFTGTTNRIDDEGSGTSPKLRTPYHELPADIHTVGLWHINETVNDSCSGGQDACDSSGNGHHGTANGTTITTSAQKLGAAARNFNGSSDYIAIPHSADLSFTSSQSFTLSAWVYVPSLPSVWKGVVTKSRDSSPWYGIWISSENQWVFGGGTANITGSSVTTGWHHVSIVQNGAADRIIYVDGINTGSGSASNLNGTGDLWIGGSKSVSEYFNGVIDEVRISNIARTPEEIKQDAQRFPYGVYSSDTIDLTSGTSTVASLDSLEWTDNVSTPGATLDGWPNFKPVIIDSVQIGNTLTNYQTKVKIDYDSNMQSDFDDLRFTSHTETVSSYGSEATFNSAASDYIAVDALDSTHIVVAYRDDGGSDYGCARIGTVSGTSITYGDENCFTSTAVTYLDVAALDSTHFVVASNTGNARIGTVSGTTISYGNNYSCGSDEDISLTSLSSTKFIIAYSSSGLFGEAKVGTISGTSISFGSVASVTGSLPYVSWTSVSTLDSSHFVIGFLTDDGLGTQRGEAKIGTVSGTTISFGTYYKFADVGSYAPDTTVSALDATHFIAAWHDADKNDYAIVGSVSGSTITYGSKYSFNLASVWNTDPYISLSTLNPKHFVISYRDAGGDSYGHTKIGSVSGNAISYGSESDFNSANTQHVSAVALGSTSFVVGYKDTGGDTYGHAKVGTVTNTNLDYWIETKSDGVEATVWVEVDTIPASSLTTIWMWYGNGGASAGSNGSNTFVFFDDFNDASLNGTLWNSAGTVSESGGVVTITNSGSYIGSKTSYGVNYSLRYRGNHPNVESNWVGFISGSSTPFAIFERYATSQWNARSYVSAETITALSTSLLGTYQRYEIERNNGSSNIYYVNDGNSGSGTHTTQVTSNSLPLTAYMLGTGSLYLDWIALRSFTPIEPITGVGADIEFQTRTSSDGSTWEAWKPTTAETAITSMDSDATNWTASTENLPALNYGSEATFNSASSTYVSTASLDSTHFVVGYRDDAGDDYGHAKVGTVSGTTISYGSEATFNSVSTEYISVAALDSTHFVVAYKDTGDDTYGHAKVGTVSGTTISYGSESTFNSAATDYISVAVLDSTHFAVAYRDAGGEIYGYAKIGTVSSTISYGSEATFNANDTYYISVDALDSTHFVVGYQNDGNNYGRAKIGSISDSTITFGDESTFNATSTFEISVAALDATHFVVGYGYSILNGRARIGTVSSTTISYGSEYTFLSESSLDTDSLSVAALDSTHFVVGYKNLYGTTYGRANVGTVSGTTISFSSKYPFNSASSLNLSVTALDADYFVVAYRDAGGDTYGHAKVGKLITQNLSIDNESVIKMEGNGSLIATVGAQLADANTAALWHLEETSGTGAYIQDETANNNDGTPTVTSVVDGFFGKGRNFNGSSDYINVGDNNSLDLTSFTVGLWVYPERCNYANWQGIIGKGSAGEVTTRNYALFVTASACTVHYSFSNGSAYASHTSTNNLTLNQWQHLVYTFNGNNSALYINGVLDSIYSDTITPATNGEALTIGRLVDYDYFDGKIDEPFVKATAMTSEEIAEAYRAGRDHRLQRTISSTDLSSKTKVPFYFAADKQGTIAETYVGETDQAIYGVDSSTVALWHLDDNSSEYEGFNSPGTVVDDATVGTITWSNPSYAKVSDDSRATTPSSTNATVYTHYLKATSFGFNIPSNAKILGIRAGIERSAAFGLDLYVRDNEVKIVKGGNIGSTNKADTGTDWPSSDAYASYGGASDLWGEIWTAADINSSNFGVVLSAKIYDNSIFSTYGRVDHMRIDVWYAPIKDESANGNMAKSRGGAAFTQGKIGGARYFDGTDDYLSINSVPGSTFQSNFTVEAWVKFNSVNKGADNAILSHGAASTDNGLHVCERSGKAYFGFYGDDLAGSASLSPNQWYHLAFVYDGGKKIYVNGVLDNSGSSNAYASSLTNAEIGRYPWSTSIVMSGVIDEVRISNTNRSADEIRLAYQYGLRTHQITSDFVTTAGSDGPTSTSDLQFTPDTTTNLYKGDTVIVRENYNGTNYIMQGEVSSISSGLVTVSSWSGTAPSGGYSTNADVFKWQREYWDLKDISPADRNTTVRLGMRILDASEGFTMYLDDFRHNTNYLTDNLGSTITSTANRYIQYRAILSTNNTEVTPELTSVTLDYNRAPTAPTSLLTEGLTNPIDVTDLTPEFSAIYNDDDTWDIANKYRIQVDDDPAFGSTIWDSGAAGTAMNNCVQGDRCQDISYAGSAPTPDTKYYWRIKYWDDQAAEGDWSTETAYFTVALAPPANCVIEDGNQPDELTVRWDDMSSNETGFRVEKNIDAAGFNYLTDKAADSTSHLDNTTLANHTYQYRVRAEAGSTYSLWCTTLTVDLSTAEGANEGFRFEGVKMEGLKIE